MPHAAIRKDGTAVITGGASGIGLAAARFLAAQGMAVALLDWDETALAAAVASLPGHASGYPVDVSDPAAVAAAAGPILQDMPPVTFLFDNAGIGFPSSTLKDAEVWKRTFDVNLWGVIHVAQAFLPGMMAHGHSAALVITGSKQGITLPPGNPAYNVSKAAVKAYAELLAHELRSLPSCKVTAHLLIPGWTHTGMTAPGGGAKPAGAWSAEQTVDFLMASLEKGDFYVLCPDNEVDRALDERRMLWATNDIVRNRPPLSRWHPDWADAFKRLLQDRTS